MTATTTAPGPLAGLAAAFDAERARIEAGHAARVPGGIRYRAQPPVANGADYLVEAQAAKGARWTRAGIVSRFGTGHGAQWAALGDGAGAWTAYHPTRAAACADMLAGRTFRAGTLPPA